MPFPSPLSSRLKSMEMISLGPMEGQTSLFPEPAFPHIISSISISRKWSGYWLNSLSHPIRGKRRCHSDGGLEHPGLIIFPLIKAEVIDWLKKAFACSTHAHA